MSKISAFRSYDLAYALMDGWELVILVDALPLGGKPGTLYAMEPELPENSQTEVDAHTMNPVAVLQLVAALGGSTGRLLVVGCEPATVDADESGNIALSPPVQAAISEAVTMVQDLVVRSRSRAKAA